MTLTLDGTSLTLAALAPLVRGEALQIKVAEAAFDAVRAARRVVDEHVEAGNVVYGLTTGFGKLKSVAVAREDLEQLQENLSAHAFPPWKRRWKIANGGFLRALNHQGVW